MKLIIAYIFLLPAFIVSADKYDEKLAVQRSIDEDQKLFESVILDLNKQASQQESKLLLKRKLIRLDASFDTIIQDTAHDL